MFIRHRKTYGDIDGKLVPVSQLTVHVTDLAVLRGYGVFDFLRTHHGIPFLMDKHLTRLEDSARTVGIALPATREEIAGRIKRVLMKNAFPEMLIYLIVTGGKTSDMISYEGPAHLFIYAKKAPPFPEDRYRNGIRVITRQYTRNMPSAKTLDYLTRVSLQTDLSRENAAEVVYLSGDTVTECSTSNIFAFCDNTLVTPKEKILCGITRETVLSLAQQRFRTEERDLPLKELLAADEVFITATNKKVLPVVRIDGTSIGNGTPGPKTRELMDLFHDFEESGVWQS